LSVDSRVWPKAIKPEGVRLAFSIYLRDVAEENRGTWLPRARRIEGESKLLGYDVADQVMTSGLSNCGYTDEEKRRLRPTWGGLLNEHHLFDQVDLASEFRRITAERVQEHAPFFVFGIYMLLS